MLNKATTNLTATLLLFALLAISAIAAADGISVSQSVDRSEVAFDESIAFEIQLTWTGGQAAYRFEKPLAPYFNRMKIGAFASSISSTGSGANEITTKIYRYTLVPTSGGIGQIDAVTIDYFSWPDSIPGELITEPLTVNIAHPIVEKPSGALSTPVIIGVVAFLVALAIVIVIMIKRRRTIEPVISEREKFLDGLTTLKGDSGTDIKQFTNGLIDLLSVYIKSEFGISLESFDKDTIAENLRRTKLSTSQREQLAKWLANFHADKFKPVTSNPGDTIRLESEVREFFSKL